MGNRFLREAILRSDRICELGDSAQLLFYKLLSVVDDYGCYDGRERVIAITAFPLVARDVTKELHDLQEREAIVKYLNAGKPYIAVMQWGEMTRNGRRKWPAPPVMNDLPGLKYRSPWNNLADGWHNPVGTDQVSILLDIHGRPVTPQPPEWRRIGGDMMPIDAVPHNESGTRKAKRTLHTTRSVDAAQDVQRRRSTSPAAHDVQSDAAPPLPLSPLLPTPVADDAVVEPGTTRPGDVQHQRSTALAATTPAKANGKIQLLDNGKIEGLSEERQVRWQEMFPQLTIPDEIDHAAEWLIAHPGERQTYQAQEGGIEAYLIRWLLREAKGVQKSV